MPPHEINLLNQAQKYPDFPIYQNRLGFTLAFHDHPSQPGFTHGFPEYPAYPDFHGYPNQPHEEGAIRCLLDDFLSPWTTYYETNLEVYRYVKAFSDRLDHQMIKQFGNHGISQDLLAWFNQCFVKIEALKEALDRLNKVYALISCTMMNKILTLVESLIVSNHSFSVPQST